MTDIEIAQKAHIRPISQVAQSAGLPDGAWEPYGKYIAKVDPRAFESMPMRAKLILVTAITPTPAGEGKTTVSVGLADGMNQIGKRAMLALREPSQGPVFGMKGGATGGGYAQVLPMENINLHFTGDLHAITSANNLLAAMVDNHIQQGNALGIDPRRVLFRRCLDVNDRQLRAVISGLGGKMNGMPRQDGFDITAASEVMAVFCLASDLADLKKRLSDIIVARTYQDAPVTCRDIGAQGAMTALLRDALMPNLVQTIDGTPCLIHGGPFANIAHGCNSVIATKLARKLSDYTVTEAGFGADLGAEKFLDIKCRMAGIWPSCVVVVATARALKHHGGVQKADLSKENLGALEKGIENLERHVRNMKEVYRLPVVVAVNRFSADTEDEIALILRHMDALNVPCKMCDAWAKGGAGALELAQCVCDAADQNDNSTPCFAYEDGDTLREKIIKVSTRVYGAKGVTFSDAAEKTLAQLQSEGCGAYPVCIAKTQYSFSDNAKLLCAPQGFDIHIASVRVSAGAGFAVAFAGDIIAMPGLPKQPAALCIDVNEKGDIVGLF